jgi:hypothetical protein
MQIEDVHRRRLQLLQTLVQRRLDRLGFMLARLVWVVFCGELEAALLPFRIAGPALLQSVDVGARRVDFVVPL